MLDLGEGIAAIVEEVPSLPTVDPDNTKQELTAQTKSHGRLALANDILHIVFEVRLEDILLCEFALQVGGQPNARQRASLGQKRL